MIRRRGNRRFRRRPTRTRNLVRRISDIGIGAELKPSFDQPSWVSAPWWPLTLVSETTSTSVNYTGESLHALALVSLALGEFKNGDKSVGFNIRILTVRAWGLDRQPITLTIYCNGETGCRKLRQLNDRGSPIHYSCLGWRYGKASFSTLNTECANDTTVIFQLTQTEQKRISVYVQVLLQRKDVPPANLARAVGHEGSSSMTMDQTDPLLL